MGNMKPYLSTDFTQMKALEDLWIRFGTEIPQEMRKRLTDADLAFINELQDYYG